MLLAALASVVIASCYDGDKCTTTTGEKFRLACINTPELVGKRAEPVPAKAARKYLRDLVVGKISESAGSLKTEPRSFSGLKHPCQKVGRTEI